MAVIATVYKSDFLDFRFDAECYKPDLRVVEDRIAALQPVRLDSVATVSDGNHISIAEHFCDKGYRYLKGAEVSDVFIDDSSPTFIPQTVYESTKRSHVSSGDVLISVIGSVGPVALVTDKYSHLSCSCKLAILRPFGISPAMLAAYLLSPTGQALLLRRNRGSVQQGVVLPDIRSFPVPAFSDTLTKQVEKKIESAAASQKLANELYPQAEAEMLERMEWENLASHPHELFYVKDSSNFSVFGRADAEFFQPHHARFRNYLLESGDGLLVESFSPKPTRGVQPSLMENGKVFVIDSKSVRPLGVMPSSTDRTSIDFFNAPANSKARIKHGDVLLNSTGRGTLGRAACYQLDELAVCDNHVTILRPDPKQCDPVYLTLFLNSPPGQAQSEQFQTGSSGQLEIYPEHIRQFVTYIPRNKDGQIDLSWQSALGKKVAEAVAARQAALATLEETKSLVEQYLIITS